MVVVLLQWAGRLSHTSCSVPASIVVNKQASRRECSQSWCRVHACCCIRLADVVRSKNVCKISCLWYFQANTRVSNWGGVTKVHCTVQMHHAHTTGCQQGKAKRAQPAILAIHTTTTHTLTLRIKQQYKTYTTVQQVGQFTKLIAVTMGCAEGCHHTARSCCLPYTCTKSAFPRPLHAEHASAILLQRRTRPAPHRNDTCAPF